jgi:hypothetical protein
MVPLPNVGALLKSDVFVNHAPMFLKDTVRTFLELTTKFSFPIDINLVDPQKSYAIGQRWSNGPKTLIILLHFLH